jgi:RNA polymerase sigma factor (sigma-70 family)
MIEGNLRLVIKVAKDYAHTPMEFADLVEEGNLGLIRAVEKFDPEKGFAFSTYADYWIRFRIERALLKQTQAVHVPATTMRSLSRINGACRRLTRKLGREPTEREIAEELVWSESEVRRLLAIKPATVSLDQPLGVDGQSSMEELFAGEASTESDIDATSLRAAIDAHIGQLSERHQLAVRERFGLNEDQDPATFQRVGDRLGVTRERARQIVREALTQLQAAMVSSGITPENELA